jgi:hypothetical protein
VSLALVPSEQSDDADEFPDWDRKVQRRMWRYDNMSPERIDRRAVIDARLACGDSPSEAIRYARLRTQTYDSDKLPDPPYREIRVDFDSSGALRVTAIPYPIAPQPRVTQQPRPRAREHRPASRRRVARTSGSRGDPPDDPDLPAARASSAGVGVSPRENAAAKGRRYLTEGRLVVHEVDEQAGTCRASCRGGGAIYRCGRDSAGWFCTCPARATCAHLVALQSVVAVERT